jgi:undecaprenyl phosphate-alpha-L-ara4N flippase subunit ArnF
VITLVATLADAMIKKAAQSPAPASWYWLAAAIVIYGLTGIGWFYVMKHTPLYVIGIVFSLVSVFAMAAVGILVFHETISTREIIGIALGIVALVLIGWQSAA